MYQTENRSSKSNRTRESNIFSPTSTWKVKRKVRKYLSNDWPLKPLCPCNIYSKSNCTDKVNALFDPVKATELVNQTSSAPPPLERSKGRFENILVMTDHLSRYALAISTRNQTAQTKSYLRTSFSIMEFHLISIAKKENPQKLTQLNPRSHPRHFVGKKTAQKTPS